MNFERLINSNFYQQMIKFVDLVLLNLLWFAVSILSLGVLLVSATNSCFIITKKMLYSSSTSIFKDFFSEIKNNWSFSWRISLYFMISILFFIAYGYSVYLFIFTLKQGIIGIIYFGVGVSLFWLYISHFVNMFIFNSYFGFKQMTFTIRASMLIIARKKLMSLLLTLDFFLFGIATYFIPLLGVVLSVTFCIYSMQYLAMKTYEQLKREEDEKKGGN